MTNRDAPAGPGRYSTRTDRSPAARGTAQLAAPGGGYGDRKAIEDQAAAAPVPVGGGGGVDGPVRGGNGGAEAQSIFGPTERPNESILTGAQSMRPPPQQGQYVGSDTDMIIEQLVSKWPDPYLMGLLNR